MRKKRVLVLTEATYLNTGYASDGREIISGLIDSGKYEVAEFSIYGSSDDPRRSSIKWKNYPNLPSRSASEEEARIYNSSPANQFGAWRFNRVILDFKPDVVHDIRDPWMCMFVRHSPYRDLFSWIWKATVDAEPQNPEWVSGFGDAESFMTLTEWGADVVRSQSDQKNIGGFASIGAPSCFKQVPKYNHKISMGINPEWKIIGTVMRNQRRKLFPELFESFSKYLELSNDKNTYLYCHTSYPDNAGWDIPRLLLRNNISSRVLFTYNCQCGKMAIKPFSDAIQRCPACNQFTMKPSNVSIGASVENLARIYQIFDLYFQCANSEGFGAPLIEAAACGVPVMATDYSAMSETVRKCGGWPVKVKTKTLELETGCYRAQPDTDHAAEIMHSFFSLSQKEQESIGRKTRLLYEDHYTWSKMINNLIVEIDKVPYGKWNIPIRQINIPEQIPKFNNNKSFLDYLIDTFVPFSKMKNSYEHISLLRDLNFGFARPMMGSYFFSDQSYSDGLSKTMPFSHEDIIKIFKEKAEAFNAYEIARANYTNEHKESWF